MIERGLKVVPGCLPSRGVAGTTEGWRRPFGYEQKTDRIKFSWKVRKLGCPPIRFLISWRVFGAGRIQTDSTGFTSQYCLDRGSNFLLYFKEKGPNDRHIKVWKAASEHGIVSASSSEAELDYLHWQLCFPLCHAHKQGTFLFMCARTQERGSQPADMVVWLNDIEIMSDTTN